MKIFTLVSSLNRKVRKSKYKSGLSSSFSAPYRSASFQARKSSRTRSTRSMRDHL